MTRMRVRSREMLGCLACTVVVFPLRGAGIVGSAAPFWLAAVAFPIGTRGRACRPIRPLWTVLRLAIGVLLLWLLRAAPRRAGDRVPAEMGSP